MKKTVDLNYKKEYEKLKDIKKENEELKQVIIDMSKTMFSRDRALAEIITKIEEELRIISKRK